MDLLIYGPAIFAGIIGSRYLSRLANFCLMVVVFQIDLAIFVWPVEGGSLYTLYRHLHHSSLGRNCGRQIP